MATIAVPNAQTTLYNNDEHGDFSTFYQSTLLQRDPPVPVRLSYDHSSYITHTSPATTKQPTIIVTTTGTVFHRINSLGEMVRPFWRRMFRHSSPAREAEKLGVSWGGRTILKRSGKIKSYRTYTNEYAPKFDPTARANTDPYKTLGDTGWAP